MVCRYGQHGCEGGLRDLAVCPLHGHTLHLRHRRQDARLLVTMSVLCVFLLVQRRSPSFHWSSCGRNSYIVIADMIFLLVQISFIMSKLNSHWSTTVLYFHLSICRHRRLYILFRVKRIILLFQISGAFTVIRCKTESTIAPHILVHTGYLHRACCFKMLKFFRN